MSNLNRKWGCSLHVQERGIVGFLRALVTPSFSGFSVGLMLTLILTFASAAIQAQDFTSAGDGDWNDTNTWNEAGFPAAGDDVVIQTGHTVTIANSGGRACANLTIEGTGVLDFTINKNLQISNNLSMSGTSSITGTANSHRVTVTNNFNVTSGTASIGGVRFTINGTTTLDGTLTFTSETGNKTFNIIDVNASGTWDNDNVAEDFAITGNVINDGSWNGCSATIGCLYDLTGTTQFSGAGTTTVADLRINSPATATNIGNLTLTDDLTGTGSFTNDNGGTLTLTENGTYSVTTLDLNNTGNTVVYAGGTNDNILAGPFYDLEVNMNLVTVRAQMSNNDVTVNNDLTLTQGLLRLQSANTLTVGGNLNINGGEFSPNNAGAVLNVTGDIIMTNGDYDHNNGDVNITDDFLISGGTFAFTGTSTIDADQITVENATLVLSGGTVTASNASATGITLNASGVIDVNAATLNVTNDLSIAGAAAELNPDNASTVINISGDLLMSNGTYNHDFGDVNITGDFTITGGVINVNGAGTTLDMDQMTLTNCTATLVGGTITASNASANGITLNAAGIIILNAATLNVTNDLNINNATAEFSPNNTSAVATIGGDIVMTNGIYDHNNGQVHVTGNFTVSNGDLSMVNSVSVLDVDGTYQASGGTNDFNAGTFTPANMTVDAGQTVTFGGLTVTAGGTANINGTLTIDGNTGDKNFADMTLASTGNLNFTSNETVALSGNLNMSGTSSLTGTSNSQILNVTGTYDVPSGTASIGGIQLNVTSTTTITGNVSVTSGTGDKNLGDLTMNSAGNLNFTTGETISLGGNLSMTGTSSITGSNNDQVVDITGTFSVPSGTASIGGVRFTANGNTTLDGSLAFTSTTGTKSFANITVNGTGTWNNGTVAEDFSISGDITNNGTWTGCSGNGCNYTLTSSSGSINGTGAMNTLSDLVIDSPGSYTNTNTGGLNVTDRITGTGTFINGANGVLSYSGNNSAGTNFDITNFDASATGNTVTYSRAGDQLIRATSDADNNYHNLVMSTAAAGNDATLAANITVDNQLTLTLGDIILSTFTLTIADGATISGGDADSYIRDNDTGVLRQLYSGAGATLSFPIGDNNDFSPITALTINSATFGASPHLDFSITDASHPNRNTSNTPTGDDDGTAAVAFISRYWTVSPNDITSPNYTVSYQYVDADVNGTESDMVGTVYRTQPTLAILDWFVTGTVNPVTNTASLTNADAFGDMYAMDNTLERLPIVLISFDARVENDRVVLNWVTASEENNSFFTIERSLNGLDFEEVLLRDGAGNSQGLLEYQATDMNPPAGRVFYRLKQTDFNGTFEYSQLAAVDVPESEALDFRVFGNKVVTNSVVKLNRTRRGLAQLILQGVDGKSSISYQLTEADGLEFEIDLPTSIRGGLYTVQLLQNGQKLSRKLLVY